VERGLRPAKKKNPHGVFCASLRKRKRHRKQNRRTGTVSPGPAGKNRTITEIPWEKAYRMSHVKKSAEARVKKTIKPTIGVAPPSPVFPKPPPKTENRAKKRKRKNAKKHPPVSKPPGRMGRDEKKETDKEKYLEEKTCGDAVHTSKKKRFRNGHQK